jgi:hypothetical protein
MTWSQLYDYMMCVLWYDLVTVIWLHDVSYDMTWSQLYDYMMCPMIWPGHSYMTIWYVSYDMTWSQLYDYMMCVLRYDLVTVIWLHDVCPMIWPGHSYMTTWCVSYDMTWSQLYVSYDMTWSQLYDYMICVLLYDLVTVIWLHDVCPMIWPGHSYMCPMIWPGHSYMTTWYVSYDMTWLQLYDYMMGPFLIHDRVCNKINTACHEWRRNCKLFRSTWVFVGFVLLDILSYVYVL